MYKNIGKIINEPSESLCNRLFLMTALNHDRAYTSVRLSDPTIILRDIYKPYLLDDVYIEDSITLLNGFEKKYPNVSAYSRFAIEGYDKYSREYHTIQAKKRDEIERIDHGILGGAILFRDMVKKYQKQNLNDRTELLIAKASGLSIAQHNMYKSPGKKQDSLYLSAGNLEQLLSTSDFKITSAKPLLLLLSLVDTIECVKRFAKGINRESSLQTLTVLRSIKIEVTEDTILLDFSQLKSEILHKKESSGLLETYSNHLQNIRDIQNWTEVRFDRSKSIGEDMICLMISER